MPGPGINNDWLAFCPRIEVISMLKECCLNVIIKNIFQNILVMNILQDSNNDIGPVGLMNMIKARPVIPPVTHLMEMMK